MNNPHFKLLRYFQLHLNHRPGEFALVTPLFSLKAEFWCRDITTRTRFTGLRLHLLPTRWTFFLEEGAQMFRYSFRLGIESEGTHRFVWNNSVPTVRST